MNAQAEFEEEMRKMVGGVPDLGRIEAAIRRFVSSHKREISPADSKRASTEIYDDLCCGATVEGWPRRAMGYVVVAIEGGKFL